MIPFVVNQTTFWFAIGVLIGIILYIIIRRALGVVGISILAMVIGSFLQPLGPTEIAYFGYVIGTVGVGALCVSFLILLIKLALELITNEEFAPYRL